MRQADPIGLAKAILWEEAKGKLRAIYMAEGQVHTPLGQEPAYQAIEKRVEAFIKKFEGDGLHE